MSTISPSNQLHMAQFFYFIFLYIIDILVSCSGDRVRFIGSLLLASIILDGNSMSHRLRLVLFKNPATICNWHAVINEIV
jgi:hypothetical protein